MSRFQKHIFICINERKADDKRGCCASRGSLELLDYIKGRVHESDLKGKVRVNKAGCLDKCEDGPSCVVYPEGTWYSLPKDEGGLNEILRPLKDGKPSKMHEME